MLLPQGAEDFRRLKQAAREAARPKGPGEAKKRRRGIAFGSGAHRVESASWRLLAHPAACAAAILSAAQNRLDLVRLELSSNLEPNACLPSAAGVLDEDDGYGEGAALDDYVTHDDVEGYEGAHAEGPWEGRQANTCQPRSESLSRALASALLPPPSPPHPPHTHPQPADTVQDDGLPRSRAPKVQRGGLGDRLAAKGYSFEIMVRLPAWAAGWVVRLSC